MIWLAGVVGWAILAVRLLKVFAWSLKEDDGAVVFLRVWWRVRVARDRVTWKVDMIVYIGNRNCGIYMYAVGSGNFDTMKKDTHV